MILRILLAAILVFLVAGPLHGRTFTDDQGRQVEAELLGSHGANVVLSVNGRSAQWPIAKLSKADQAYVKTWLADPPRSPDILVNVWERDGIGSSGLFAEKKEAGLPKNIPLLKSTEEKARYRYYDIDLSNRGQVDARKLFLSYVVYVIDESNRVVDFSGSETVEVIPVGAKQTVASKAATYVRTKTTSATFGISALGHLTTGTSTDRAKERFGGIWARVYDLEGNLLGERKDLHDELERLDFRFTGATGSGLSELPVLETFEKLQEFLKQLPKPPSGLPKPPEGLPKPPFAK